VSIAELNARPPVALPDRKPKPLLRPSTIMVGLVAMVAFSFIAQHVLEAGYLRKDIEALQQGEAWRTGGWLTQVVLRIIGLLPDTGWQQLTLSFIAALAGGALLGVLYDRLRANGWFAIGAVALVVAVACHVGTLYTVTASSRAIPLLIAIGAMNPAIRMLEDVGDVQSAIALSLLLPLLLLASPLTSVLIVPIAIAAALLEPDGRRDPRAFVAMLLVAILPTVIVAFGIVVFIVQAKLDLADALLPYVNVYASLHAGNVVDSLAALFAYAPAMAVPLVYCVWPDLAERRHVLSALAVVALPLYLAVARVLVDTTMTPLTPAVAFLVAILTWLSVVRLPFLLRLVALVFVVLGTALSWQPLGFWDDLAWREALFSPAPTGIAALELRPGL